MITGGSGFLASAVVKKLTRNGYELWSTTRNSNRKDPRTIFWDLEKPETIDQSTNNVHFDIIIHLACKVGWDGSSLSALHVPNIVATQKLAELACRQNAFLLFSSAALVHGSKAKIIKNNSKINCDTAYAESKLLAEQEIKNLLSRFCILRIGGIFGKNGPSHLGLNRAIRDVLLGKNPIYFGSGLARRNYISVLEVARVIHFVCEKKVLGVHLCAGSSIVSFKEMLEETCNVFNPRTCKPQQQEGPEAYDQIIEASKNLPLSLSFKDSLRELLA